MERFADMTLRLNAPAIAIGHLLSTREIHFDIFDTQKEGEEEPDEEDEGPDSL